VEAIKAPEVIVDISDELAEEIQPTIWINKLVLVFERSQSPKQVHDWLHAYNYDTVHKLIYIDVLANNLYVVQINTTNTSTVQSNLISKLPLCAKETFASVNLYDSSFDAKNPVDISHLVTTFISKGDPEA
jgi:hypothetical protein